MNKCLHTGVQISIFVNKGCITLFIRSSMCFYIVSFDREHYVPGFKTNIQDLLFKVVTKTADLPVCSFCFWHSHRPIDMGITSSSKWLAYYSPMVQLLEVASHFLCRGKKSPNWQLVKQFEAHKLLFWTQLRRGHFKSYSVKCPNT